MFHRAKKLVNAYRERLLSLVLLPAFFLGTLPHTACICADGHREEFCRATACRFMSLRSSAGACGECSCCQNHSLSEKKSCCRTKHGQPTSSDSQPAKGLVENPGSCCHPIVEAPAPAVVSAKSELPSKSAIVAAIEPVVTLRSADKLPPTFERTQHSTPPPLDVVIVYLHLTI